MFNASLSRAGRIFRNRKQSDDMFLAGRATPGIVRVRIGILLVFEDHLLVHGASGTLTLLHASRAACWNTSKNISRVSFPVCVFWFDG